MDMPPTPIGARQGLRELGAVVVAIPAFLWISFAVAVAFNSTAPGRFVAAAILLTPGVAFVATAIGLVRRSPWVRLAFLLAIASTLVVFEMVRGSIGWSAWG